MIYDCFTYNGEREVLELRIRELALCKQPVTHILVESNKTFTGIEKPLYFEEVKDQYKSVNIFHLIVDDMPEGDAWAREVHQRNRIMTALHLFSPNPTDTIIISDVDEVVRAKMVDLFKPEFNFAALILDKYSYYLNCLEGDQAWDRARIMTWEYLKDKTPEEVRNIGYDITIRKAGWHWSWLGGVNEIKRKLNSFSHTEVNTPGLNDEQVLLKKLETGQSLWTNDPDDKWKFVEIDLSHPEYLYKNIDKFKHLIK